jgi:hypothetical protein
MLDQGIGISHDIFCQQGKRQLSFGHAETEIVVVWISRCKLARRVGQIQHPLIGCRGSQDEVIPSPLTVPPKCERLSQPDVWAPEGACGNSTLNLFIDFRG